ncbi:CRISPR-associated protein Cas10/Cmr2, subtype III-B [Acididesulfobacillus acetoxydans]|uniref:CRISPR-associated protein Cas10/Cmr2, subtype III-B n=1 Tax=Acididesulfobacillus acetoxydans TaxID=1561005 RepID=A0A8S0XCT3_9FIRM|nr:type III-B CRISPR-associated protein Cas10/Cmr2 [Acididesulfobacillus acetoxydans]CAA7602816.1 CRISPR-associated protein Cas10/Cmr2, subtype III-B [Acididesulfobacillus acetoxydans]CEJ06013.1 CRISPR-associated protein, Cmr2 [Acididesulfobacillus acetoxydans]
MKEYLFLFTVTPVQLFIAQARKTQDLCAGSALLSHFCRRCLHTVQERYQGQIVFPLPEMEFLPNRFLAVLEGEDDESMREIGERLEEDLRSEVRRIAEVILDTLNLPEPGGVRQQTEDYFRFFWAFSSLECGYEKAYRSVERLLGQAKSVRPFKQSSSEPGRKCSLTGEQTALFYRSKGRPPAYLSKSALKLPSHVPAKYMAEGEALGAVGFIKRCAELYLRDQASGAERGNSFPSTCRIALSDAYARLADKDAALAEQVEKDFDDELVFYFKEIGAYPQGKMPSPPSPVAANDWAAAWGVYTGLKRYEIRFSPYYAILVFDGDSMGKWLSGQRLTPGVSLRDFHRELSLALSQFARRAARDILVNSRGVTVYAGGDDFLGLVNLSSLMEILKALRSEFDRLDFSAYSPDKLTFSAGVAIAHYKTPLGIALNWARRMEKEAKEPESGKDALGLAVVKHSGETVKTVGPWRSGDETWLTDDIQVILKNLDEDFSDSFITIFGREFRPLSQEQDDPKNTSGHLDEMVRSELRRLLLRSYSGAEQDKRTRSDLLWNVLSRDYIRLKRLDSFLDFLEVVRFLSREAVPRVIKNQGA